MEPSNDDHLKTIATLKTKIELLQEELMTTKKASKCPNCTKLRHQLEQIQEAFACPEKKQ